MTASLTVLTACGPKKVEPVTRTVTVTEYIQVPLTVDGSFCKPIELPVQFRDKEGLVVLDRRDAAYMYINVHELRKCLAYYETQLLHLCSQDDVTCQEGDE